MSKGKPRPPPPELETDEELSIITSENVMKVILLGDSAVGKSKLVERFLMDGYEPRQLSTYALTLFRHVYKDGGGEPIQVDFWDTAGQERFNSIHPSYYFKAHACILCFDVTRKATYKNMERWYTELRDYCGNIPVLVCANKIDIDYKVTSKSFNFAAKRKLPFFFVSAADGTNVVQVFNAAIQAGQQRKQAPPEDEYFEVLEMISENTKDDNL